jgi:seryl-tRNA synthetase
LLWYVIQLATELSIETNAKKIKTLTKVAKLLRNQIQEQNKKIDSLQVEIIKIREQIERISKTTVPLVATTKDNNIPVTISSSQETSFQKDLQLSGKEKIQEKLPLLSFSDKNPDDKEQLLKALKIIDEL